MCRKINSLKNQARFLSFNSYKTIYIVHIFTLNFLSWTQKHFFQSILTQNIKLVLIFTMSKLVLIFKLIKLYFRE